MDKLLTAVLLALCATAAAARPAAIDAYLAELDRVERAAAPLSLEPLFAAADQVQAAVMQLADGEAWLETLGEEQYSALQAELRGFELSRGYDIYAQPLPLFFLSLAQARGRPADIGFFILYWQYWSADFMPVFQRQAGLPTPCVRYDEGVLTEVYEAWLGYVRRYPGAYAAFAEQTVADVEEMVSLGTCACADERSVVRELKGFLRRFPDMPVADQVRARLHQLNTDPEKLPVRCR